MLFDDLINKTVFESLLRGHKVITLRITRDLLNGFTRISGKQLVKSLSCAEKKLRVYKNVRDLPLASAERIRINAIRSRCALFMFA